MSSARPKYAPPLSRAELEHPAPWRWSAGARGAWYLLDARGGVVETQANPPTEMQRVITEIDPDMMATLAGLATRCAREGCGYPNERHNRKTAAGDRGSDDGPCEAFVDQRARTS